MTNAHEHRSYLCLTTVALAAVALLFLAGCQTPNAATTVAPPATGMIGQPAQYGSWATPPQGAAYPPAPVMPGPSAGWQPTAPMAPTTSAAPAPNTWKSKAEVDPYSGGILYWARLDGTGLVVSSFTINANGKPELQTYRRSLNGKAMRLDFSNVTDGKLIRSVKGSLRRLRTR